MQPDAELASPTVVGAHPRALVRAKLKRDADHAKLDAFASQLSGHSLTQCGIDPARFDRGQIAVGEPLRVAAELEGAIDTHALACVVGDASSTRSGPRSTSGATSPAPVSTSTRPPTASRSMTSR